MIPIREAVSSSIFKKLVTAVTGVLLIGFIITHLAANLLLLSPNPDSFNHYVQSLYSWGVLLVAAEIGLGAILLVHAVNGFRLKKNHRAARDVPYKAWNTKGSPPSRTNFSSMTMIISGTVLLAFLIIHIKYLRFGPGVGDGYVVTLHGEQTRDLKRLAFEHFQNPFLVAFYEIALVTLGTHLRHGFWSAFQSLGIVRARNTESIYRIGTGLSVLLTLGFMAIPICIYLGVVR